jgi:hypothetical protein
METIAAGSGRGFTVELGKAFGKYYVYVNGERFYGPTPNHDKAVTEYTILLRRYTGQ